jgi:hypothetical protein
LADSLNVSISPASISASQQAETQQDIQVAVMKKSHDVQEDTAAALIALVKQSLPPLPSHVGTQLDVLA